MAVVSKIEKLMVWLLIHWVGVIACLVITIVLQMCIMVTSAIYGYWSNALYGTHFEIQALFSGFSLLATGTGAVAALGAAAWAKYKTDSQDNTNKGDAPDYLTLFNKGE